MRTGIHAHTCTHAHVHNARTHTHTRCSANGLTHFPACTITPQMTETTDPKRTSDPDRIPRRTENRNLLTPPPTQLATCQT